MAAKENSEHNGHSQSAKSRTTKTRRDETGLTELVKAQPIVCLAIAGAAGFIFGGGARHPGGIAILAAIARIAAREAFGDSAGIEDFIPEQMGKEL